MATIRQKKLAREIVKNLTAKNPKNKKEILVSSGYTPTTAESSAHVILSQPGVVEEIKKLGISDDELKKKHTQLLNAVNLEKLYFDEKDSDETIRDVIAKMEGYTLLHIVTQRMKNSKTIISKYAYVKAPDNQTQDKALDKAFKIRGAYVPEPPSPGDKNVTNYNFIFAPEVRKKVREIDDTIKAQLLDEHGVPKT